MAKNKYWQYMTPKMIADFMVSLSTVSKKWKALEPSSWEGVFLSSLKEKWFSDITSYEIDNSLIQSGFWTINTSFVSANINDTFDLIIWNPPYIRRKNLEEELREELEKSELWSKYCNSFCDYSFIFIIKSIELLKEGWELIFITPEYWLSTTHSQLLRNYMIDNWYIEKIYHFNETPIFEKATVSTIIFKFVKSKKRNNTTIKVAKYFNSKKINNEILDNLLNYTEQDAAEYFEIDQFKSNQSWILAHNDVIEELSSYENSCRKKDETDDYYTVKEFCDIWNGMVSWLDKAFQIDISLCNKEEKNSLLSVIKAKNLEPYKHWDVTNYLFVNDKVENENDFKSIYPNFYIQLEPFIEQLNNRYQYNREIKYWEWVFLRNYNLFSREEKRIFVPCKERISNKDYFRFSLVEEKLYPTQDVTAIFKKKETQEDIYYILALLNSKYVFDWLRYNWIVKWNIVEFSEKPIASIPYRKIDFNNISEVEIHNKIVNLAKEYINSWNNDILKELNIEIDKLFIW